MINENGISRLSLSQRVARTIKRFGAVGTHTNEGRHRAGEQSRIIRKARLVYNRTRPAHQHLCTNVKKIRRELRAV